MKSFGTALSLATVASAVNVNKARHNPAFDQPTQTYYAEPAQYQADAVYEQVDNGHYVEDHDQDFDSYYTTGEEYNTGNSYIVEQEPVWEAAPRYWGDQLQYRGPTQVNFSQPKPFVARPVEYESPRFLPYIPKYKNNYFGVDVPEVEQSFGSLFKPYEFFSPVKEDHYGDPIYEPKHDKLHGKPPKKEEHEDLHARLELDHLGLVCRHPRKAAVTSALILLSARHGSYASALWASGAR